MNIGRVIKDWRYANRLGLRDAAKIIGLSAPTLSRLERGHVGDGKSIVKLMLWLFAPPPALTALDQAKGRPR